MKISVFYSYSHKDTGHRKEIEKSLGHLRNNNLIDELYDTKIKAGADLHLSIDVYMNKADVILILLSPDYISSSSCQQELKIAFELKDKKEHLKIIPIVIRDCAWKDDGRLLKLKALPDEGSPLVEWQHFDKGLQNIYEGIKGNVEELIQNEMPMLEANFKEKLLNNPIFSVDLERIFIFPDLENIGADLDLNLNRNINSKKLINLEELKFKWVVIDGEEQSGKSTLCNMLYLGYVEERKFYPILIKGAQLTNVKQFEKQVEKAFNVQYASKRKYFDIPLENRVLFVDDLDEALVEQADRRVFIETLKANFNLIFFFIDELESFSAEIDDTKTNLSDFVHYSIKELGYERQDELLRKCIEVKENVAFDDDNNEMLLKLDKDKEHVEAIIGTNIVPIYPVFLLTIFNTIEEVGARDYTRTSYGHCYHAMVTLELRRSSVGTDEIDTYFNFLTELAFYIFRSGKSSKIETESFHAFFKNYESEFNALPGMFATLSRAKILVSEDNVVGFGYRYIYYYFVAKYLSEHLDDINISNIITEACNSLHDQESANIVIFLTHHTKNSKVIDEIIYSAMGAFENLNPATLSKLETDKISDLIKSVPRIVKNVDHKKERARQLKEADISSGDGPLDELIEGPEEKSSAAKQQEDSDLLIEIKKSVRSMEVIGQILRNQVGSLPKKRIEELYLEGHNTGLRLLKAFLADFVEDQDGTIAFFAYKARKNQKLKGSTTEQQILEISKKMYTYISYRFIFGIIHKIVHSIGYDKLVETSNKINAEIGSNVSEIICFSINAWYRKDISYGKIKELNMLFKDNEFMKDALRDVVIQHLYMHKVPYKLKQQIAEELGLKLENQVLIQSRF